MGYILQAADGAHLGLAAQRKLTSVVVLCAVAELLLFFQNELRQCQSFSNLNWTVT